jgi:hypothetical protein
MLLTLIVPQQLSAASAIWNSRPMALWVSCQPKAVTRSLGNAFVADWFQSAAALDLRALKRAYFAWLETEA